MPKKPRYSQAQLRRAMAGEITRNNTRPGSANRAAVYRAEYLARLARHPEDIRKARSHPRPRKEWQPPVRVVTPAQLGELTMANQRDLRRWRESSAPAWLPKSQIDMGDDTAALIASAGIPPNKWRKVEITFLPDGTAKVTITPKHPYRYAETIILPDPSSVREMTRWLSSLNYPGLEVRIDNSPASPRGQLAA